jgi:hypothetical protein
MLGDKFWSYYAILSQLFSDLYGIYTLRSHSDNQGGKNDANY